MQITIYQSGDTTAWRGGITRVVTADRLVAFSAAGKSRVVARLLRPFTPANWHGAPIRRAPEMRGIED